MTDVYRKELCLAQLRDPEKVGSYRSVIAYFPPRSAEFGLQTDALNWGWSLRKKRSDSLTISHLQQCILICEKKEKKKRLLKDKTGKGLNITGA